MNLHCGLLRGSILSYLLASYDMRAVTSRALPCMRMSQTGLPCSVGPCEYGEGRVPRLSGLW